MGRSTGTQTAGFRKSLLRHTQDLERLDEPYAILGGYADALQASGIDYLIYVTTNTERDAPFLWANIDVHDAPDPSVFDPFLRYCCSTYEPTRTGVEYLSDYAYLDPAEKAFIRSAGEIGFRSGLGVPVSLRGSTRYGGFNYGTGFDRDGFEARIPPISDILYTTSLIIHRRVEELAKLNEPMSVDDDTRAFRGRRLAPESRNGSANGSGWSVADLTGREREVLFLLSQGFARKEIAHLCAISENTVGSYVKSVYRKLGVNNRAEATRAALDIGLTPPLLST